MKSGDSITLYIPNIVESFPDMNAEGWSVDDAEAFCSKYGLTISTTYQETTQYDEGKVISQSRAAGSPIVKGTTLKIVAAKKPTEKKSEEQSTSTTTQSTQSTQTTTTTTDTTTTTTTTN